MESVSYEVGPNRTSGDGMEEESAALKHEQRIKTQQEMLHPVLRRITSDKARENVHRKMSNSSTISTNTLQPLPGFHSLYRRPDAVTRSLAPVIPMGELIQMTPRLVKRSTSHQHNNKTKPPRFIPYEPYPCAINEIITSSSRRAGAAPKKPKINKNNLDIGVFVKQVSNLRTQELDNKNSENQSSNNINDTKMDKLEKELQRVTEERDYYQTQYNFQTQVNSELKNLLVASVGEDLQTHVNVLTEDKLQLARALLDTANSLTTHTEQIEFLAGQCEVWRSKFLSSSVMVEELARWKADLTQKNQMLNDSTRGLLQTIHQIRDMQLDILRYLKFVAKIRYLNIPATDVISLSAENLNIIQQMVLHSGVGIPEASLDVLTANKDSLCEAEKCAVRALQFVSQPLLATDDAIKALFGQANRKYREMNTETGYKTDNIQMT